MIRKDTEMFLRSFPDPDAPAAHIHWKMRQFGATTVAVLGESNDYNQTENGASASDTYEDDQSYYSKFKCIKCTKMLPSTDFSKSQRNKPSAERSCKACIDRECDEYYGTLNGDDKENIKPPKPDVPKPKTTAPPKSTPWSASHSPEKDEYTFDCCSCFQKVSDRHLSETQKMKKADERRCQPCVHGPDYEDPESRFVERKEEYCDEVGRYLDLGRPIIRDMRLKYIRFTQATISSHFRQRGRQQPSPIEELVDELRRFPKTLEAKDNHVRVCLYQGKYWSVDNRRLYCMKQALREDTIIQVKYYPFVNMLSPEEFLWKWSTTNQGESIKKIQRGK